MVNVREIVIATTKSFAIRIITNRKEKCYNMIIKNELMSNGVLKVSKIFGTLYYNQKEANIEIYENLKIRDVILELPEKLPESSLIEIILKLNKIANFKFSFKAISSKYFKKLENDEK